MPSQNQFFGQSVELSLFRGLGAWSYQTGHTENRKKTVPYLLAPTPLALAMCPPTVLVVHHLTGDSRGTIFMMIAF